MKMIRNPNTEINFDDDIGVTWPPCGSVIESLPAIQETWVRSLDQEVPLEKQAASHSSILASGKSHGQRSLEGYSHGVAKKSDTA